MTVRVNQRGKGGIGRRGGIGSEPLKREGREDGWNAAVRWYLFECPVSRTKLPKLHFTEKCIYFHTMYLNTTPLLVVYVKDTLFFLATFE